MQGVKVKMLYRFGNHEEEKIKLFYHNQRGDKTAFVLQERKKGCISIRLKGLNLSVDLVS